MLVTDQLVEKVTGVTLTLVRPPYGAYNQSVKDNVGKPIILWDVDTLDWKHRDADRVEQQIIKGAHDGAIILVHDLYPTTVQGVLRAIPRLQEMGYQLVTVPELYAIKGQSLKAGTVYTNRK